MSSEDTTSYAVEFLNSLDLSGMPSHKLELNKKRTPGYEPETSRTAGECLNTELNTHFSKTCFAFRRNGYENAFFRDIQNETDHSHLQNPQKIISIDFPEEENKRVCTEDLSICSRMLYHGASRLLAERLPKHTKHYALFSIFDR
ncbi:hypothetical protein TNCV_3858871 [Trichonephila clavipes]|nr:hypothetical protein TNCV_3858871 [Trichonephila clavipes]